MLSTLLALTLAASTGPQPWPAARDTVVVHRYSATEASYDVNAWWLESADGVVLVDALFLGSDSRLLAAAIRATGKPLVAILLTHPHVDHYGGVAALREAFPDVELVATAATAAGIQATHDRGMAAGWLAAMAPDYGGPAVPDQVVASGTTLTLAGMRFRLLDLGAAEAENNTVIHNVDLDVLFTGDATVAHAPVYVGEGHLDGLLGALDRLAREFPPEMVAYSGHYAPMPLGVVVADNRGQLQAVRDEVRRAHADPGSRTADGALRRTALPALVQAIAGHYAHLASYGLTPEQLARMNLAGLLRGLGMRLEATAGG